VLIPTQRTEVGPGSYCDNIETMLLKKTFNVTTQVGGMIVWLWFNSYSWNMGARFVRIQDTWRIIPVNKWVITMVSKSPK